MTPREATSQQGRPHVWAALLIFAALIVGAGCDDDPEPPPTNAPPATAPAAAATQEAPEDLAALIGTRAALPPNDPIELAARYGQTQGRAPASKPYAGEVNIGDSREFVVVKISGAGATPVVTRATATLRARTEHAYFYVDEALGVSTADVEPAASAFESETWPAITGAFGPPPSPGVDGDPRIIVLQTDLGGIGGYHSGEDLYVRAVHPLSNEAEMVYIDSSNRAGGPSFDIVVAHEFQHLIHKQNDPDEEAWVNEGLSIAAESLVGGALSTIDSFEARPTTQLNRWQFENTLPHYGAAGAFFLYLAGRFGGDAALGQIAAARGDGPAGVDEFLASLGEEVRFVDVFADWATANALNRADGPYANPTRAVEALIERSLAEGEPAETAANQFGVDYYELSGITGGEYVLRFDGESEVDVLPTSPSDGGAFFFSNTGDNIDTTLTRELDLSGATAPSLRFSTWYDIERYYDRGYVSVSADGGGSWRALPATSTTTDDLVQLAYGPGFDGRSGDPLEPRWIDEEVDLREFAGHTILVRFEYVTDGGTHGEGWAVRDIALADGDAEQAIEDDWAAAGWVRIDRALPQTYMVRIIGERADGDPVVLDVPLDDQGDGELRFDTDGVTDLLLAIAGTTEGTNVRAPYTVELARP